MKDHTWANRTTEKWPKKRKSKRQAKESISRIHDRLKGLAQGCILKWVDKPCFSVSTDYPMLKGITCVTFDDDIKASQGLWLYNENVVVSDNACMSGTCGFFNSSAQSKLELAYFSNSLDIFETFSVSFFFKRSAGVSGQRSLLDNSQCSDDGSLYAKSVSGGVSGSATNSAGDSVDFDSIVCTHILQDSNSNCVFFKVSIYYHLQWNYLLIFISWLYIVYILLWHF